MVESPTAKCWKYREPGREYDTYTFECTISDCSVESFIAMTSDINTRASWDANCLKIEALAIAGPQTLRKLHGQDGDSMTVQWVAKSPFPLKNREYLMQRDLATLPPARAGGPVLYFKADRSSTPDELAALGVGAAAAARRQPRRLVLAGGGGVGRRRARLHVRALRLPRGSDDAVTGLVVVVAHGQADALGDREPQEGGARI